jgi:arylsulfatase
MEIRRWNAQPSDYFLSKGIKEKGGIRNQYSYVNDIAPTTLELIKGEFPQTINGVVQKPFEGKSLVYSFENAQAKTTHTIQHNEIKGKRSIYKDGWKAAVYHEPGTDFSKDVWELYNQNEDFNERIDLAKKYPEKLKELQDLFDQEAYKYNVYPLQDNTPSGERKRTIFGNADKIVLYQGIDQILNFSGHNSSKLLLKSLRK